MNPRKSYFSMTYDIYMIYRSLVLQLKIDPFQDCINCDAHVHIHVLVCTSTQNVKYWLSCSYKVFFKCFTQLQKEMSRNRERVSAWAVETLDTKVLQLTCLFTSNLCCAALPKHDKNNEQNRSADILKIQIDGR